MLAIGDPAPQLVVETVAHDRFDLSADAPAAGTLVAFHRGRHCKWTRRFIKELDDRIGDFALRGIRVITPSADSAEDAKALVEDMQIIRLPVGYGLDVDATAAGWGLYKTVGSTEPDAPALHLEPALIWVTKEGKIGSVAVASGPNLWSDATNTIRAIENTMNKFPQRGAG